MFEVKIMEYSVVPCGEEGKTVFAWQLFQDGILITESSLHFGSKREAQEHLKRFAQDIRETDDFKEVKDDAERV